MNNQSLLDFVKEIPKKEPSLLDFAKEIPKKEPSLLDFVEKIPEKKEKTLLDEVEKIPDKPKGFISEQIQREKEYLREKIEAPTGLEKIPKIAQRAITPFILPGATALPDVAGMTPLEAGFKAGRVKMGYMYERPGNIVRSAIAELQTKPIIKKDIFKRLFTAVKEGVTLERKVPGEKIAENIGIQNPLTKIVLGIWYDITTDPLIMSGITTGAMRARYIRAIKNTAVKKAVAQGLFKDTKTATKGVNNLFKKTGIEAQMGSLKIKEIREVAKRFTKPATVPTKPIITEIKPTPPPTAPPIVPKAPPGVPPIKPKTLIGKPTTLIKEVSAIPPKAIAKVTTPSKYTTEVISELHQKNIPVSKEGVETLTNVLKKTLDNQKGFVNTEAIAKPITESIVSIDKLADEFTRYRGLSSDMVEKFIAVDSLAPQIMQESFDLSKKLLGGISKETRKEIQYALEENTVLPEGTERIGRRVSEIQNWSLAERQKMGYIKTEWPETQIKVLRNELKKKKNLTEEEREEIKKRVEKLEKLKYIHRVTFAIKGLKAILKRKKYAKKITAKPYHFLGRNFDTIREAEKAGYKVGDLMTSVAETIHDTRMEALNYELIQSINKNSLLSAKIDKAPNDWVRVDDRLMPSAKGKAYHPAIARALRQMTYASGDTGFCWKTYDKINTIGKMIGFYNPFIMAKNDVFQGWRAAGLKFFAEIPNAIMMYAEDNPKVLEFERQDLFNTMIDYSPAIREIVQQYTEQIKKSVPLKIAEGMINLLNPKELLQTLYKLNNKTTWEMDKILRIACRLGIEKQAVCKNLSPFEITDKANDFMANYNKVPKQSRRSFNRVVFTAPYKISMGRVLGQMWKSPVQHRSQILRHYGYKLFFKFALPAMVGAYVLHKNQKKVKVKTEGYRLVVTDKIGEKVYSFSDPLLEEAKIMHRNPKATVYFNLSFGLQFLFRWLDKTGASNYAKSEAERFNEYFKIGAPGIRDYLIWKDADKNLSEKIAMQLGLAYIYIRQPYKYEEKDHNLAYKILTTLDLLPTWLKSKQHREILHLKNEYSYYQAQLSKYIRTKDKKNIKRIREEVKRKHGVDMFKSKQSFIHIFKDIALRKKFTKEEYMYEKSPLWVKKVLEKRGNK